jgi:ATP-dependent exoDNAse (exonuclease V) beta subunit
MLNHSATAHMLSRRRYERMEEIGLAANLGDALNTGPLNLKVQNERGFAIREGGKLLTGFIDRLVLLESKGQIIAAEIIDFKTDAFDAADARQVLEKTEFYAPQLDAYRLSVAQLTGLPTDRIAATLAFVSVGLNKSV